MNSNPKKRRTDRYPRSGGYVSGIRDSGRALYEQLMADDGFRGVLPRMLRQALVAMQQKSKGNGRMHLRRNIFAYICDKDEYAYGCDDVKTRRIVGYAAGCVINECVDTQYRLKPGFNRPQNAQELPSDYIRRKTAEQAFSAPKPIPTYGALGDCHIGMTGDFVDPPAFPIVPPAHKPPFTVKAITSTPHLRTNPHHDMYIEQAQKIFEKIDRIVSSNLGCPSVGSGGRITLEVLKEREAALGKPYNMRYVPWINEWFKGGGGNMKLKYDRKKLIEALETARDEYVRHAGERIQKAKEVLQKRLDDVIEAMGHVERVYTPVDIPRPVDVKRALEVYDGMIARLGLCADDTVELEDREVADLLMPHTVIERAGDCKVTWSVGS